MRRVANTCTTCMTFFYDIFAALSLVVLGELKTYAFSVATKWAARQGVTGMGDDAESEGLFRLAL